MPVVRLNDATFSDLKTISKWLDTETPSQTIDAVVAQMLEKLDLARDADEVDVEDESDTLEFDKAPGLSFTRVLRANVADETLEKPNWASLLLSVVGNLKANGFSADELVKALDVPASRSRLNTQGYTHHQKLGISIQGQSAQDAWKESARLAEKYQIPVHVHFRWRDNPKAQHPGRDGILRAGGAK